jgi:hypothetical protein
LAAGAAAAGPDCDINPIVTVAAVKNIAIVFDMIAPSVASPSIGL